MAAGPEGECFITTQKALEGPVLVRDKVPVFDPVTNDPMLDNNGKQKFEEKDVLREIEIIKVILACVQTERPRDEDRGGKHSVVHSRVETFIVECKKDPGLHQADCVTHRGGQPGQPPNGDGPGGGQGRN